MLRILPELDDSYHRSTSQSKLIRMICAESSQETFDYTAELEKLAKLRSNGIITEEEFQAEKKHILGLQYEVIII